MKKKIYPEHSRRIGCLGFSADPPHIGHLNVARLLLKKKVVDEIWLIPCREHPFGKPLSEADHRWQMAKFLEGSGVIAKDIELARQGKSYTIDTIKILREKHPNFKFFWVVGDDIEKYKSYERWKDWPELASLTKFLVVPRINNISSTDIRERVCHGLSIEHLVPPKIKEYIEKHNLYK